MFDQGSPERADNGRNLRDHHQSRLLQPTAPSRCAHGIENQVPIKAEALGNESAAPAAALQAKEQDPASIIEVLTHEWPPTQIVTMVDDGVRHVCHLVAAPAPSVAEFLVLCGLARNRCVETAKLSKSFGGKRKVICSKKPLIGTFDLIVPARVGRDVLASSCIWIGGKAVFDIPAQQAIGIASELFHERRKPSSRRKAIIVEEGQKYPPSRVSSGIARRRRPEVSRLHDEKNRKRLPQGFDHWRHRLRAAIVNDHYFKGLTRGIKIDDRFET